jgi:hypothetical protein
MTPACHIFNGKIEYNKRKEKFPMPFSEACIYQVKPQKVEEFEALMLEAKDFLEEQEGLLLLRFMRRGYHIDMEQIREGLPPLKLTRIVKSVKYVLYWEFDTKENYGEAQKNLYDSYWKAMERCLVVPHDKYLGEELF